MAFQTLHFIMLPHLAQGHMIPMIDMAKLLAHHRVEVTVITTPINAAKFTTIIRRAAESGLKIQILHVQFPSAKVGLPEGCENVDTPPARQMLKNFLAGINMLQDPVERLLDQLQPRPSCIISDKYLAWTDTTARKFQIPRIVFDGTSCFSLVCTNNIIESKVFENLSDSELFVVPGLPDRIELTKLQLPRAVNIEVSDISANRKEIREKELAAYGTVVNSFEELEPAYVEEIRKSRGKVWCIGPASLCNKESLDKAERGNKAGIDENQCLKWLDSQAPCSVVYACLGSDNRLAATQMIELGLGLEKSNQPFIWVIGGNKGNKLQELEKWILEEKFEERIEGRGLLIRGWAPQVLILSHLAVGGFLTHCGWNSTLEGICAGLPMVTWPMFAEQFYNENFVVQVLKIGMRLEEAEFGGLQKREQVKRAVQDLMDRDKGEERRKRARKLGEMGKRAIEEGGSSYLNVKLLIQGIMYKDLGKGTVHSGVHTPELCHL